LTTISTIDSFVT